MFSQGAGKKSAPGTSLTRRVRRGPRDHPNPPNATTVNRLFHTLRGRRMKRMARLAWFSPMPPARTGVAVYSAELLPLLRRDHQIDVYVDEPIAAGARGKNNDEYPVRSAHDFIWAHRLAPYDLTVFQ